MLLCVQEPDGHTGSDTHTVGITSILLTNFHMVLAATAAVSFFSSQQGKGRGRR